MVDFICVGLLLAYVLIRLLGVVVWEYETKRYFKINSKIFALCSCNRSVVVTYIYIHTHK